MSTVPTNVEAMVPPMFMVERLATVNRAVTDERIHEFSAKRTSFYTVGDTIEIDFSSATEIIDLSRSYIRYTFKFDDTSTHTYLPHFDICGVHGQFRRSKLETIVGNTPIQDVNSYNRNVCREILARGNSDFLDIYGYGGGLGLAAQNPGHRPKAHRGVTVLSTSPLLAAGATSVEFPGTTYAELYLIQIGDYLGYQGSMNRVVRISPNRKIYHISGQFPDIAAGFLTHYPGPNSNFNSTRFFGPQPQGDGTGSTTERTICFHPMMDAWEKQIPLFAVPGGLRQSLTIESGARAFVFSEAPTTAANLPITYTITNVTLVAVMITPHPNVRSTILDIFSAGNFKFRLRDVMVREVTGQSGGSTETYTFTAPLRSIRGVQITLADNQISEGVGALTRSNYALSHFVRDGVTEAQLKFGTFNFPNSPIDLDYFSAEMYRYLLDYRFRYFLESMRESVITPEDWSPTYFWLNDAAVDNSYARGERFFVFTFDLSRYMEPLGFLTGVDGTQVSAEFHVKREEVGHTTHTAIGYPNDPIMRAFLDCDTIVAITPNGAIVSR